VLRHQLIVLRRRLHGRGRLTNNDRWFFIQLYRWFPSILSALTINGPETLVRWHRAGFRCYWRWKSRPVCFGSVAEVADPHFIAAKVSATARLFTLIKPMLG
jgi:hypothetical protein